MRKRVLLLMLATCSFLLLGSPVIAATYYVSTTGNDSNNGMSQNAAFSTFTKAVSVLTAGDTLLIAAGTYNQKLLVNKQGNTNAHITIKPISGAKVIINTKGQSGQTVAIPGQYIDIEGIETIGGGDHCVDITGQYIVSKNFIVHDCYNMGTYVDGQHVVIDGHEIYDSANENRAKTKSSGWGSGLKVRVGGDDIIFQNNVIYNNYGEGIAVTRGKNTIVRDNIVYDNYSVNIYIDNSINTTVERNLSYCTSNTEFYRNGKPASAIAFGEEQYDGWGAQLSGANIYNNIAAYCSNGIIWWGSDISGGGLKDAHVYYNTLWGSTGTALSIAYSASKQTGNIFANNIIQQPSNQLVNVENAAGSTFHHNFWVNANPNDSDAAGTGDKTGNVGMTTTPVRDNPTTFRLSQSSPAINSGQSISEVPLDFEKKMRSTSVDMGAIEFGSGGINPTAIPTTHNPQPTTTPIIPSYPSWWNTIPVNLRNFLEQLYVLVYYFQRTSNLQYLLEGVFPVPTP